MRAEIDEHTIEFEPGTTVLAAARQRGIEIPTLCHVDGIEPLTSCFLCVVEVEGRRDFQPACATRLDEGMRVRTNTPDIRAARKTALELLLSDHAGCCVARCTMGCPADLDIPGFIAELRAGRLDKSIAIIK
ncbi:MAG: 2Fe-2S iron-sulfur cluster-binding protein, partial [Candidatus Sumerlaeota bacterium]|nr:2Fe-2S iron-sulfur cluster-binding protein [Candidatus Sumerlaeota bacterium]